MTLKEAYEKKRHENISLRQENSKQAKIIEKLRKGTYSDPEKIANLKKITKLDRENKNHQKIIDRYRKLLDDGKGKFEELTLKYDRLEEENRRLQWHIDCLEHTTSEASVTAQQEAEAKIRALSDEVARLTAILDNNGTNTGTPTSKTPLNAKKVIPNSRKKSGKPKGGQKGHKKHTMPPFAEDEITEVVTHELDSCPECGGSLTESRELPKDELDYEVRVIKKRHLFKEYVCDDCGRIFRTKSPSLKAENQYGAGFQGMALSLLNIGFVSINRTKKMICGIAPSSVSVSEGYLSKLQKRYASKLAAFVEEVRLACIDSALLYWDDTVVFVNTKRACMRFYGNESLALYTAHMKKDLDGILDDNLLQNLSDLVVVMHDHNTVNYNANFRYRNVECLQHLERDLQKLYDISKHEWADSLKKLIALYIHKRKQLTASGETGFSKSDIDSFMLKYDSLLASGYKEYIKDLNRYFSNDENALLNRLEKYRQNYTEWIRDFSVPTTNNLSERSLRFVKNKDKVSGQFQNIEHAKYFADIRTYIETCARNGVNEHQALLRLTNNDPYTLKEITTTLNSA